MDTISTQEAERLRALSQQYQQWLGKRTSYKPEELPAHLRAFTNEQRSQLELYDFVHNPPDRYFAYYTGNASLGERITTGMGDLLGSIVGAGATFTSNMGDMRRHVTIKAVNGRVYKGIAQLSSGTYLRMRLAK